MAGKHVPRGLEPHDRMADHDSYAGAGHPWVNLTQPPVAAAAPARFRQRYWLHALLFVATLYSTTLVGARLAYNFQHNLPAFDLETDIAAYLDVWNNPSQLLPGLPFSEQVKAIALVPVIRAVGDGAKMLGYPAGWVWRLRNWSRSEIHWRRASTSSSANNR